MQTKKFIVYWLPALLYASLIFAISSIPMAQQPQQLVGLPYVSDKLLHVVEFFILGVLILWGFQHSKFRKNAYLLSILVVVLYGIADEVHQLFVVNRVFDIVDMAADGVGGLLVLLFKLKK